jgi:outer membrane protein insertion porin family
MYLYRIKYFFLALIILSSCRLVKNPFLRIKNPPNGKPFLVENIIIIKDKEKFNKNEQGAIKTRLENQLDDSSKVPIKENWIVRKKLTNPVVFDTTYAESSRKTMEASLHHLGFYNAVVGYTQDTTTYWLRPTQKRITSTYTVTVNKPTLIDTITYKMKYPDLQQVVVNAKNESFLLKNVPITKVAVLAEKSRLVDIFRNNGYYKFTAAELRVRGDTSISALTNISDDPFEMLEALNEAQKRKDSPTIKLAIVLNKPEDTTKLNKFFINKIYVLSDFRPTETLSDVSTINEIKDKNFTLRYHQYLFKKSLLESSITFKSGDVYKQTEFDNTVSNLTRLGVWQSVNIKILENYDSANAIDVIIELLPAKRFSNENSLEASYSTVNASGNSIAGSNLWGISANLALTDKNVGKEAIKMTHNFRFGIELNNKKQVSSSIVNSNELGYSINIVLPRRLIISKKLDFVGNCFGYKKGEFFGNINTNYNNRFNLFTQKSVSLNVGTASVNKKGYKIVLRPLFTEYSSLSNESDTFKSALRLNPFLRYSYNTSFVAGSAASFSMVKNNFRHLKSQSKEIAFKGNIEFSYLPFLNQLKKSYSKLDLELKYTVNYKKKALAFRLFLGAGIPILGDSSLPFFKQFTGGGANSMRGWPARGIGVGGQPLTPYVSGANQFNDRTGDMQLELNGEWRHDLARIIPDLLYLKGAVFFDAGNVWNIKNKKLTSINDITTFNSTNFYKQLGLSAGYGLRFDVTYLTIRADFSFRFKRPETSDVNNGWKVPDIGLSDGIQKIFSGKSEFKDWRYNNFNFTLGINYPF